MRRGFGYRVILTLAIVAAVAVFAYTLFTPRGFPVNAQPLDEYTFVLHPLGDLPLPPVVRDGDRVDIRDLDFDTRATIIAGKPPLGYQFDIPIERGLTKLTVPAKIVDLSGLRIPGQPSGWFQWSGLAVNLLLGAIALLLLWRGRDRAAFGMGLWAITFLFAVGLTAVPQAGWVSVASLFLGTACFLISRPGFYIMIEARLGQALSPGQRSMYRGVFLVFLGLGAVQQVAGQLVRLLTGSAEFLSSQYGLILTASYLVPIVMLFAGYPRAPLAERLRLRWMLVSSVAWAGNIFLQNSPFLGASVSNLLSLALQAVALVGFLYAVLRLRVVDISVVIDRALVYGVITTLVVGIIAAVNSLAVREFLPPGAGLALQVMVYLALGIVLGRVRNLVDKTVEQLFFRSRYLAEKALKNFARHVGHFESTDKLLEASIRAIQRHTSAPAVAIYTAESGHYRLIKRDGDAPSFPQTLDMDDPIPVALRADDEAADLADYPGALGEDGCAFPMTVLGSLHGIVICRNRPGEHYSTYEKQLLTDVARSTGAAWRILRARDNEALVAALAGGAVPPEQLRERARAMVLASNK